MPNNTTQAVCRLLGGSGRPQLRVVASRKLPALCSPFSRPAADTLVPRQSLPLAA